MNIAIIGAAGAIGRSIAAAYHAAGESVRLAGRKAASLQAYARAGDEVVEADMATAEGCRAALSGAETAVYTLGLPYEAKAFAAYPPMMRLFVAAAREAGVRRALLITNVYPYGRPLTPTVDESHPRIPCSVKGRYRMEQEDILLGASGAGLETLSLRLPDFYGPQVTTSFLDMTAKAAAAGKPAMLLAPADTPHEFVFTPDVGPVVRALLRHQGTVEGPFNFAGAGVTTQRDLATLLFRAAGQEPRFRVLPPLMQNLLGLFVPFLREHREMRYLHETPVLMDDAKLRALLPDLRKTPYAEGARLTVAAARATPS